MLHGERTLHQLHVSGMRPSPAPEGQALEMFGEDRRMRVFRTSRHRGRGNRQTTDERFDQREKQGVVSLAIPLRSDGAMHAFTFKERIPFPEDSRITYLPA